MYYNCSICGQSLGTGDTKGICIGCINILTRSPKYQNATLDDKIKELEKRLELLEIENKKLKYSVQKEIENFY